MAFSPSSPTVRLNFLEDMNRITRESARIKKKLQLNGLAAHAESLVPIRSMNVHGHWDGIVGHPVEVKIGFLVCSVTASAIVADTHGV